MLLVNVCLYAVFFSSFLCDANVLYKNNTRASVETRERLTLSEWLPQPNGEVKHKRTQAYAREGARTHMILESKTLVSPYFQP